MSGDLRRLVYVSTAMDDFSREDLHALAADAAARNQAIGVTGMLMYKGGSFLQVLEGPDASIQMLLDRIEADSRHLWVSIVTDDAVDARAFSDWGMGLIDFDAGRAPSLTELAAVRDFITNCHGLDNNAAVAAIIMHFERFEEQARDAA
ncbi:MAG: BLUF domain-containing protein [Planctomycetota bacterium]